MLGACYRETAVTPCTLTCNDAPCPSGLACGSDFLCQTPGMPLCSMMQIDAGSDAPDGGRTFTTEYVKAPHPDAQDRFGTSVAVSGDGTWLVVGAPGEASNATGIDGDQNDNSLTGAGAVYIYKRVGSAYMFQTYLKSPSPDPDDRFGTSVSISSNATTIAVGVPNEDGGGVNLTGDPADNAVVNVGAVFVFQRAGVAAPWMQAYYVKPPSAIGQGHFGQSVALSDNGAFVAIGYPGNASAFRYKLPPSFTGYGGVPSGANAGDEIGAVVAIAGDGQTRFGAGPFEDSPGTDCGGDASVDGATDSGGVFIETQNDTQKPFCKPSNTGAGDHFGAGLASDTGADVFAVGAPGEDSNGNGNEMDNSEMDSGAVYVFGRTGLASWAQTAYLKAPTSGGELFGSSIALNYDGTILVGGAPGEGQGAGAVYGFKKTAGWDVDFVARAPIHEAGDALGTSIAVSKDGLFVIAGAPYEASGSIAPADNSAPSAGAVYVFR
jgi:hypothetical protein